MKGRLFIPSYRRSDKILLKSRTLSFISKEWLPYTTFVVREDEADVYKKVLEPYPVSLAVIPSKTIENKQKETGREFMWADTMDDILDDILASCIGYQENIVIMDDDLTFAYRPFMGTASPVRMTENAWNDMMQLLMLSDKSCPLSGIPQRGFVTSKQEELDINAPLYGVFGVSVEFFGEHTDYRFCNTGAIHMPDRALVLKLLQNGYTTRVYNRYCTNDVADTSGGCSLNRTAKDHSASAIALKREYPDLVDLTTKTNLGDVRIGTRVQWSKAFKESPQ